MQPWFSDTTVRAVSSMSCLLVAPVSGDTPNGLGIVRDCFPVPQLKIIGYSWSGLLL